MYSCIWMFLKQQENCCLLSVITKEIATMRPTKQNRITLESSENKDN